MQSFKEFMSDIVEALTYSDSDEIYYIDGVTLGGAVKAPELKWLAKNWVDVSGSTYNDQEKTLRLDVKFKEFSEFKSILGLTDKVDSVYISSKNVKQFDEFVQVMLNKNLEYGLSKIYPNLNGVKIKGTTEYKKREKNNEKSLEIKEFLSKH